MVAPPDNGDEVARQRRKRIAPMLDHPVTGFADTTLGDVMTSVLVANEESGAPLNTHAFLSERGYDWRTVETVLAYLSFVEPEGPPPAEGPPAATATAP